MFYQNSIKLAFAAAKFEFADKYTSSVANQND